MLDHWIYIVLPHYVLDTGNVVKAQCQLVLIDTNTNCCAQNRFHNPILCVFEHKLADFVPRGNAACRTQSKTQTQTNAY
jgi:hypothetical protein